MCESVKQFLLNLTPLGMIGVLFVRIFLGSWSLCGGISLFNFKNLTPVFTWKRVIGICFMTLGLRLLIDAIFSFSIS